MIIVASIILLSTIFIFWKNKQTLKAIDNSQIEVVGQKVADERELNYGINLKKKWLEDHTEQGASGRSYKAYVNDKNEEKYSLQNHDGSIVHYLAEAKFIINDDNNLIGGFELNYRITYGPDVSNGPEKTNYTGTTNDNEVVFTKAGGQTLRSNSSNIPYKEELEAAVKELYNAAQKEIINFKQLKYKNYVTIKRTYSRLPDRFVSLTSKITSSKDISADLKSTN